MDKRHARKGQSLTWQVGATVRNVPLDDETAQEVRSVCLARYGKADKATVVEYIKALVKADTDVYNTMLVTVASETE